MISIKNSWRSGPKQSIVCKPPHDRPIFSLAVSQNTFVTGSADHGLRQYNFENGKHIRELFSKRYGHKQWVSTCAYTPSGRILSGAMDSVVCYWQNKAVKCDHFVGHKGSISKVMGNDSIGISASYDATMILWDLSRKQQTQQLIGPHKQAIMDFAWHNSLLVSGDKSGVMGIWDLNRCSLVRAVRSHKGAISGINFNEKNGLIVTTGLNDGCIVGFDMRTNSGIHKSMIHKGSVNGIKNCNNVLLTCSADGTIKIITVPDFQTVKTINTKDMIFAVEQCMGTIIAGTAGGNILSYDMQSGQSLYGYGAMKKGGCRLLGINKAKNRLVCCGQDQNALVLVY